MCVKYTYFSTILPSPKIQAIVDKIVAKKRAYDLPPKLDCYLKDCFRYCIGLSPFNFNWIRSSL